MKFRYRHLALTALHLGAAAEADVSGRVSSNDERRAAARIAMETGDVENVRNNLVVDPE